MRIVKVKQQFLDSLLDIRDYIAASSPQNAGKFIADLRSKMNQIIANPESFSPEKNLLTKRRIYRFSVYKKHYKIIFKVLNDRLVFLDIVHGKRHPDHFKGLRTTDYR
jgi:plasmid stabilization system protein ParE